MSDLSEDIGTSLPGMDDFFSRRIERPSGGFRSLDLTSVPSYSDMDGRAERGRNRAGMFVMLASEGTSWDLTMSSYDVRDRAEKASGVCKNDIDGSRPRMGDPDRARGRFFIKFVALILRMHIRNAIEDHDEDVLGTKAKKDPVSGKTVDETVRTLSSLTAVGNTGDWKLTAVSRDVREIFAFFGLGEPESGQTIIG
ncbi:MAG: hypothetical protein AB7V07_03335 [Candidatus Delongbacteria bacterium]|jgi:hypothetical protein